MDLYPDDIPLKHSVPYIKDEQYWIRSYHSKFSLCRDVEVVDWKEKYLSKYLQDYLENANPDVFIEEDAAELAQLVSPYIKKLVIEQLNVVRQPEPSIPLDDDKVEDVCPFSVPKVYDHIPLEPVLRNLRNLEEISLIFGMNNVEESYLPRYFKFSLEDCDSLCGGLKELQRLRVFRINRSNLDCSKAKLLLQNLVKISSIEELDFNHCRIGDYGMKALAGFIMIHKNLRIVRIANNCFKEVGVQGIAYALQMKPAAPLQLLDCSLNFFSVESASKLAAALVRCKEKPQTLILNSCGFHGDSAEKIVGLLSLNRGLTRLDMAANNLSGAAEKTLIISLEKNRKMLKLDFRGTHISTETQARVDELLERNRELMHVKVESSEEIPPLYLDEPEYLVWEYNPDNPHHIPGKYPPRIPQV
ncbi:dynein regulatory complex subunit 5-like isoform X2 [Aricia agestis]|nr:dynein regulatory complex subunit 5-like isoform X2 [Aricia agestis]